MVNAGMACLPERWPASKEAIFSLKGQVRQLYIYWADESFPLDLEADWITVTNGPNRGDFSKLAHVPGDFISCDDDLIYPPTYVEDFLNYSGAFQNAILTHHGKEVHGHEPKAVAHCLRANPDTKRVDVPGTGVSFYPAHIYAALLEGLEYDWNCLDILVGSWMRKNEVKAYALPHKEDYFGYIPPPEGLTIWDLHHHNWPRLYRIYFP
jgi:hypothetical protein